MASKLNDPNFGSRDYDPSRPEDKSKLNNPNFGSAGIISSEERSKQVSEYNQQKREEKRGAEAGLQAISENPQGRKAVLDLIGKGGSLGRRIEREIRRYESTGRISGWLSNSVTQGDLRNISAQTLKNSSIQTTPTQTTKESLPLSTLPLYTFPKDRLEIPSKAIIKPWDIIIKKFNGDPPSGYTLKVSAGTISNILPSNWDDEWSVGTDLVYGIAKIKTDGKNITSISIDISNSKPSQQAPKKFGIDSSIDYLFGIFEDGGSSNVLGQSIYLYPKLRLVTSADPPAAVGESPFDLWYELAT